MIKIVVIPDGHGMEDVHTYEQCIYHASTMIRHPIMHDEMRRMAKFTGNWDLFYEYFMTDILKFVESNELDKPDSTQNYLIIVNSVELAKKLPFEMDSVVMLNYSAFDRVMARTDLQTADGYLKSYIECVETLAVPTFIERSLSNVYQRTLDRLIKIQR